MIATESTAIHPYRRIYALFYDEQTNRNRFYYLDCNIIYNQPFPRWIELPSLPGSPINTGVSLAFHSIPASWQNLIFVIKGENNREFWVYNIDGEFWKRLEDIPINPSNYVSLEAGGYTFWNDYPCVSVYLRDNPDDQFWRYHYPYIPLIQTPITWWERLKPSGSPSQSPSQMAYDPGRKSMYVIVSATVNGANLKEYIISDNKWVNRPRWGYRTGFGLQLAARGVVGAERFPSNTEVETLYYLRGDTTKDFDDYLTRDTTWSPRPSDPLKKVYLGSGLAYGSLRYYGYLMEGMWAFFGDNTDTFGFFYPEGEGFGGGQSSFDKREEKSFLVLCDQKARWVKFFHPNSQLEIYNSLGEVIYRTSVIGEGKWDYRNFPSGLYFYKLKSTGFSRTGKIAIYR